MKPEDREIRIQDVGAAVAEKGRELGGLLSGEPGSSVLKEWIGKLVDHLATLPVITEDVLGVRIFYGEGRELATVRRGLISPGERALASFSNVVVGKYFDIITIGDDNGLIFQASEKLVLALGIARVEPDSAAAG